MKYISVLEFAKKNNISERSARNYCAQGRIVGSYIEGKTWRIPQDAKMPTRKKKVNCKRETLLEILKKEKELKLNGGIYHKTQITFTYNSNHIEGSKLTHDQTRYIFETNTIGFEKENIKIDDIIETTNHFRCIDLVIELAKTKLTESFIKQLHLILKTSTMDSNKDWFNIGDYKKLPNEVGGKITTHPNNVKKEIKELLERYNALKKVTFEDIAEFHKRFEDIHPFQDGNGRIGRLIMFKECLKHNIVPILITDNLKMFYYRGLKEWDNERGYLLDTLRSGQDIYKSYLDYFEIKYNE